MPEKHMNYLTRRRNGVHYFRMAVPRAARTGLLTTCGALHGRRIVVRTL